jgi:hypothetical protein
VKKTLKMARNRNFVKITNYILCREWHKKLGLLRYVRMHIVKYLPAAVVSAASFSVVVVA